MSEEYTKEKFLVACKNEPEESKKVLVQELNFTPDGIRLVFKEFPVDSGKFLSEFLGETFTCTDGQVTKVLEKGLSESESMASVMHFMYYMIARLEQKGKETFDVADKEKREKTEAGTGRRGREATNWAEQEVPFVTGSAKSVIFAELQKFTGKKEEFLGYLDARLKELGVTVKNPKGLLATVIRNAKKRGWNVSVVEDKYVIAKA